VDRGDGVIEITIHVVDQALDGLIYDLEIFYSEQSPPWQVAHPIQWPEGWNPTDWAGGLGFATTNNPLRTCQPVTFIIHVIPSTIGNSILIHVTDKDHNNLGYIVSQRVPGLSRSATALSAVSLAEGAANTPCGATARQIVPSGNS
jgi:hypothetical protein